MRFIERDEKWGGRRWALTVFFSILILHCVAILFFIGGFLLTRTELPHYSQCSDVSQSPCNHHEGECWTKPALNRVVIIVLDALRFDFVAPSTFFEEKKPWMDKLEVLHKLASQSNTSARIFKAIADPPTTSLQRLKGLTTGGLPTFIDIGNSFGAPAIVEDNLIHQLAQNGKRVVMMGDDTWLQCFPHHFNKSYPFPSFNVKDLDTVDNGCIEHLFPNLLREDWDVLVAHFLGVDHAGHIFSVESSQMDEKLEQYNDVLEKVVDVLVSQSGPGGIHENTMLIVMGDHGQTLNGDHGGGSAEEVETSIFAMSLRKPSPSVPLEFDMSSCRLDLAGRNVCISSIEQLDFAVTVSALLGLPFPYGRCGEFRIIDLSKAGFVVLTSEDMIRMPKQFYKASLINKYPDLLFGDHIMTSSLLLGKEVHPNIGHVNPMLYAMVTGTWNLEGYDVGNPQSQPIVEAWMHNYANVLCINSWQVKKYIDVYSASSVVGFSKEDLVHVSAMYSQAMNLSSTLNDLEPCKNASCKISLTAQIDLHSKFLASIAELARAKWTEFNLRLMGVGFGVMLISIIIHLLLIKRMDMLCEVLNPSNGSFSVSSGLIFTCIIVLMRACSFLSNSYILEEGKVACFLLASTGMFYLRYSLMTKKRLFEAVAFVVVISMLRFSIELGLSKQGVSGVFYIDKGSHIWMNIADIVSMLPLIILAYFLYKSTVHSSFQGLLKYVIFGTILSYILIAAYWALESNLTKNFHALQGIRGNYIPRVIYLIGFIQLLSLALVQLVRKEEATNWEKATLAKTVTMISAWSSTVIILSGKQGPLIALTMAVGGWMITRLKSLEQDAKNHKAGLIAFYSQPVTQWSLLATCMFFSTGHWCAFDGLRWAAAFVGFDEFNLIRQAILLSIDTFGFSHILPTFGLPFLVAYQYTSSQTARNKRFFFMQIFEVYLIYGLIMAVTATFTIVCVIIQRRHLMVWGLFAPKFVFDVVGLILTDVIICIASLFYFIHL